MDRLTWMLTRMLRDAARLLPSARREWAEAVRAEADLVPAGWPRVGWLAGGLWLAVKEAEIMRKVVYWLGIGAVAAGAGGALRRGMRPGRGHRADGQPDPRRSP